MTVPLASHDTIGFTRRHGIGDVEGEVKYVLHANDAATRIVSAGFEVAFPTADTSSAPNTWTLGIELNGENDELGLTPQVRKGLTRTGALAAAFGVQIPLNERSDRSTRAVGYLLWEYLEPVRARR